MITCKDYIGSVQKCINPLLLEYVSNENLKIDNQVVRAMSYSLMAGGKRIRPALCLAANESVGGNVAFVMPLACALEMIHTYSLIHDDLPAMDDDILRRGQLTCHKRFDEATAILAGDALLTLAFEILAEFGLSNGLSFSKLVLQIIRKISVSAGFKGMIAGQMQDIKSEGIMLSQNQLKNMHFLKTGMLIKAAVSCGAIVGCANKAQRKCLEKYAYNLGLAFQVIDDILNVVGDSVSLGKNVGTDLARTKNTYPSVFGLAASKKIAKQLVKKALSALEAFDERADSLRIIAYYVGEKNL